MLAAPTVGDGWFKKSDTILIVSLTNMTLLLLCRNLLLRRGDQTLWRQDAIFLQLAGTQQLGLVIHTHPARFAWYGNVFLAQCNALAMQKALGQFFRQLDGRKTRQQGIDGCQQTERRFVARQFVQSDYAIECQTTHLRTAQGVQMSTTTECGTDIFT